MSQGTLRHEELSVSSPRWETILDTSYVRNEHECLPYNFKDLAESMGVFLDVLKFMDEELN
jgi:hypothetical protein